MPTPPGAPPRRGNRAPLENLNPKENVTFRHSWRSRCPGNAPGLPRSFGLLFRAASGHPKSRQKFARTCTGLPRAARACRKAPEGMPKAAQCAPELPEAYQELPRNCPETAQELPHELPQSFRTGQPDLAARWLQQVSVRSTTQAIVEKASEHAVESILDLCAQCFVPWRLPRSGTR